MDASPTRPVSNRPLGAQSSSSTIDSKAQPAHRNSSLEIPSSNGTNHVPSNGQAHHGTRGEPSTTQQQQAPFFERVGVRGDVKVVQNYSRIVKQQNARLREMERIHKDLQERLELETKEKEVLLATLELRERDWERRLAQADAKYENLQKEKMDEINKNKVLREILSRKDQDIHRMMQRKYDPDKKSVAGGVRHQPTERQNALPLSASSSPADARHSERFERQKGPFDYKFMHDPPDATRETNVAMLLEDLFGVTN